MDHHVLCIRKTGLVGDAGDFERIQHSVPDSVNDGNTSPIGNMWCTNGVKDLYTGNSMDIHLYDFSLFYL